MIRLRSMSFLAEGLWRLSSSISPVSVSLNDKTERDKFVPEGASERMTLQSRIFSRELESGSLCPSA